MLQSLRTFIISEWQLIGEIGVTQDGNQATSEGESVLEEKDQRVHGVVTKLDEEKEKYEGSTIIT